MGTDLIEELVFAAGFYRLAVDVWKPSSSFEDELVLPLKLFQATPRHQQIRKGFAIQMYALQDLHLGAVRAEGSLAHCSLSRSGVIVLK